MVDKKKPYDTMRIDLIPDQVAQSQTGPKGALSSLTRMNWTPPKRTLHYVARSQYKELLQSLYDAALVTNLSGDVLDVNSRAEEFLQYDADDLSRMNVTGVIHGADESLLDRLRDSLENERHCLIEAYCVRSDGSTFPAEIAVNKLRLDELCLCFFIRDITVRMQTQEMLRLEHNALQIAGSGIVIADLEARIDYANPAFAGLVGVPDAAELVGADMAGFFRDRAQAETLVGRVLRTDSTFAGEMEMNARGGAVVYALVSATCNRDADGEPRGIVFSFADVTERTVTQDELERRLANQTSQYQKDAELLRQEIAGLKDAAQTGGR